MFEQESGTAPGVELGSITDRMEVRKAVQSGQVEQAIDKVNDMNPEVRPAAAAVAIAIAVATAGPGQGSCC
jgi:hypothetical protein